MIALELNDVTKSFGGIIACKDINFKIEQGQIMGLIGPNGAGKTTIFNLVTGIYGVSKGQILFENKNISGLRPDQIVHCGIARTFQNIRLFKNLTTLENVHISVDKSENYPLAEAIFHLPKMRKREKRNLEQAMEYLDAVGLTDKAASRADSLPYGLQRKLEIARALALHPRLLLLDEPAAGMNPEESLELVTLIRQVHNKYNLTTLLIEHHMDVIMELCERIFVLNFGVKLAEGKSADIQTNPDVLKAYLGEGYKRARN